MSALFARYFGALSLQKAPRAEYTPVNWPGRAPSSRRRSSKSPRSRSRRSPSPRPRKTSGHRTTAGRKTTKKVVIGVTLRKGVFTRFLKPGQKFSELADRTRRAAIGKATKAESASSIIKRLVLLRTFNKNKNPGFAAKLDRDIKWLQAKK
jgi:hypothetical protein